MTGRPAKPRRVSGGVKIARKDGDYSTSWAATRWLSRLVDRATPEALVEGIEYARIGQTRRIDAEPGKVFALVQGRAQHSYKVSIELPAHPHEGWERIIAAMSEQAVFAAKLLAGELPTTIEDVFGKLGLALFPREGEIKTSCTCAEPRPDSALPNCKHVACAALLIADRLASDPFQMFALRGISREDLFERLRQRRASADGGSLPVYQPHIPGVSDLPARPIEECVEGFWEPGPELATLDLPIGRPVVSHPLLRRLGPSPFAQGQFPLVGLLATCYEIVSEGTIREELGESAGQREE